MKQGEQGEMFPSLGSPVLVTYSKEPGPGREMRLWAELYRRSRRELPVPPLPRRTGAWVSQDCLLGLGSGSCSPTPLPSPQPLVKEGSVSVISWEEGEGSAGSSDFLSGDLPSLPTSEEGSGAGDSQPPSFSLPLPPPFPHLPPPSSISFSSSRPLSSLHSALAAFCRSTAAARRLLSLSRPSLPSPSPPSPPRSLPRWRRAAPREQGEGEVSQWRQLSKSLVNLRSRREGRESSDSCGEGRRLDLASCQERLWRKGGEEERHAVCQAPEPSPQLCLAPYQLRVQASLERLSVPGWYREAAHPHTTSLRTRSPSSDWRRHTSRTSLANKHASTTSLSSSVPTQAPASCQPAPSCPAPAGQYLGWRRLTSLPAGPAGRLARSVAGK